MRGRLSVKHDRGADGSAVKAEPLISLCTASSNSLWDFPNKGHLIERMIATSAKNASSAVVPILWRRQYFLQHCLDNKVAIVDMLMYFSSRCSVEGTPRFLEEDEEDAAAAAELVAFIALCPYSFVCS